MGVRSEWVSVKACGIGVGEGGGGKDVMVSHNTPTQWPAWHTYTCGTKARENTYVQRSKQAPSTFLR